MSKHEVVLRALWQGFAVLPGNRPSMRNQQLHRALGNESRYNRFFSTPTRNGRNCAGPGAVELVQKRLAALSESLGGRPYLDGDHFTAGDLMMTAVLRILKHTDLVTSDARRATYVGRCTSRPAFKRALEEQLGDFRQAV